MSSQFIVCGTVYVERPNAAIAECASRMVFVILNDRPIAAPQGAASLPGLACGNFVSRPNSNSSKARCCAEGLKPAARGVAHD